MERCKGKKKGEKGKEGRPTCRGSVEGDSIKTWLDNIDKITALKSFGSYEEGMLENTEEKIPSG